MLLGSSSRSTALKFNSPGSNPLATAVACISFSYADTEHVHTHIYIYIQRQKKQGGGGSSSKATLWEGGHRMVGLARWPGMISPRVCDALASSLDCLPTLLALAGVKLPTDRVYDGIDLAPVLFKGIEQGHTNLFHPNKRSS